MLEIFIAFILDCFIGDPHWLPHPVVAIGKYISWFEKHIRPWFERSHNSEKSMLFAGFLLTLSTIFVTVGSVWLLLWAAGLIHPIASSVVSIYFLYSAFALKCLGEEGKKVRDTLLTGDIKKSRRQIAMLVGRDTENLTEQEIIKATVETVAENTVDGVISPLCFAVFGVVFGVAAPFVMVFKAISTLDSMVGYQNEKYLYFGRFSAKTDDVANYLPARLTALLMIFLSPLGGGKWGQTAKILWRDRRAHKSPNCAYPEAAAAGMLGVQLGGTHSYFGRLVVKPTIGDDVRASVVKDIDKTIQLMNRTALLFIVLTIFVYFGITQICGI